MDDKTMLELAARASAERLAFERWAESKDFPIAREKRHGCGGGAYMYGCTQGMWMAWIARAGKPISDFGDGYEDMAQQANQMFSNGFTTGEREEWLAQFESIAEAAAEIGKGMGVG